MLKSSNKSLKVSSQVSKESLYGLLLHSRSILIHIMSKRLVIYITQDIEEDDGLIWGKIWLLNQLLNIDQNFK